MLCIHHVGGKENWTQRHIYELNNTSEDKKHKLSIHFKVKILVLFLRWGSGSDVAVVVKVGERIQVLNIGTE